MTQEEDDGFAYIITSGKVSAVYSDGTISHLIRRYKPGDLIGGCALLGRMTRVYTLQAEERTSALRLKRDDFQKVMEKFPADISKITGSLISELAKWDKTLLERQFSEGSLQSRTLGVSLL
jgi:CRP-like cAMP-binding protein